MKKLIFLFVLLGVTATSQAQQKPKTITKKTVQKDSIPLFYGLTAKKILSLSVPEGKALIKKYRISVDDYFRAKLRAKIYLSEKQIKKDSIETMEIYDRIGRKLGMKKKNE